MSLSGSIAGLFGVGQDAGGDLDAKALAAIEAVNTPHLQDLTYKLQLLVRQGQITPEQAQTILANPTAFDSIHLDPSAQTAQMKALEQLGEISDQGGMTMADKAALSRIQSQTAGAARGARGAIMQNAQERGVGGSGMELAAQLMGAQGAASDASQSGLDVAAQAQARALEALKTTGAMGGQIRGQQFGEASKAAEAKDAIDKFNAANKQSVINSNVDRVNAANAANLGEKQRISDTNTGFANEEKGIAANAYQTDYENRLKKAAAKAGQLTSMANAARDAAGRRDAFTGAVLGTAGTVAAGGMSGRNR